MNYDYFFYYIYNNKKALEAYENAKKQRLISAAIGVGTSLAGGYLKSLDFGSATKGVNAGLGGLGKIGNQTIYGSRGIGVSPEFIQRNAFTAATGGLTTSQGFKRYASGGLNSSDKVPALLTAGEVVVNREAVRKYGVDFFDKINNSNMYGGRMGYATGGTVGGYSPAISSSMGMAETSSQMVESINRLIASLDQSNENYSNKNKQNKTGESEGKPENTASNPVINFTFNIEVASNGQTKSDSQSDGAASNDQNEKYKEFSQRMQSVVVTEIIKQKRPGGLLQGVK
jgi:hypothetical protein